METQGNVTKFDNGNYRFNIFPTLVYVLDCSDLVDDVKKIAEDIVFNDSQYHGQSEDLYALSNTNTKLVKEFENRVNDALAESEFENPFKMTTSWFTRIAPYGHIETHNHTNCIWSSVFYFEEDNGMLTFIKDTPAIHVPSNSSSSELGQYGDVGFPCQSGRLLLFPSILKHKVICNSKDNIRYSMAMNYMPDGQVVCGDSSFNY